MARLKNDEYAAAFSKNLKDLRKNIKKITQATLAANSGLDLAIVQRIETTNGNVTISTLLALAKGLKIHPQKLLEFDHRKFI